MARDAAAGTAGTDAHSEFQELSVSPQSWQLLAWSTTPAGAAVRSNGFFFVLYCLQPRLLPFIATFQIFHSPGFKFLHELSSDSRFDNSVSWILVWNWSIHRVYESEWVMSLCIHSKHERQNDDVLTQPFAMCVYFWIVKNHHMWWGNEFLNRGLCLLPKFMTFCHSWNHGLTMCRYSSRSFFSLSSSSFRLCSFLSCSFPDSKNWFPHGWHSINSENS